MNARVTVLQDVAGHDDTVETEPEAGDVSFEAEVLALEQPVMEIRARTALESGTPVRIDTADAIWLGEATDCQANGEVFAIRIRLRHVLKDFETLARLAERFGNATARGATVQI